MSLEELRSRVVETPVEEVEEVEDGLREAQDQASTEKDPNSTPSESTIQIPTKTLETLLERIEKLETEAKARGDRAREDISPEEAELLANPELAELMQILTRGLVNDKLADIPNKDPNRHYVWARETDVDISRYQTLGYRLEHVSEDAKREHPAGDSRLRLGDVVCMSIDLHRFGLIERAAEIKRRERQKAGQDYYKSKAKAHAHEVTPIFES